MPATFDVVANAIATTCRVPREAIVPECNMVSDLGIDSLDLLDLGLALEDMLGVRVPLDTWLRAVHMRTEAAAQHFIVKELCDHVDALRMAAR
ncbi:MAG TPA: acyl carrier protein [Acetobacteraceae bacterium]|nr:acyl carrier protein [Acetobacteraceae bacterium]